MRRIVTISYTGLDASGGVPKFNRDLHAAFPDRERVHFCWADYPWHPEIDSRGETEWGRARILNEHLVRTRLVGPDDVVIADGFWAAGLEHLPLAVSHSHGIWSHLTADDVKAGKQPDMPYHHAAQVAFRQRWTKLRKHFTAVSDFIANQMKLQWGFGVDKVINNGVDTDVFKPIDFQKEKLLVVHGVNDKSNANKGWDHIEAIIETVGSNVDVMSLDEASFKFDLMKPMALAAADIVVHPSGYEGNSMFVAEALSCGVPVVGYNVGFLWTVEKRLGINVLDRNKRSPKYMADAVKCLLEAPDLFEHMGNVSRETALESLSIKDFRSNWRDYVEGIER